MADRILHILKISGVVSLGLLTGFSYSLSSLAFPFFLNCDSIKSFQDFKIISNRSLNHIRALAGFSSSSFLLAYFFAPYMQKHPYLLWTSLMVGSSFIIDLIPSSVVGLQNSTICKGSSKDAKTSGKHNNQLDASYELLAKSNHSDDEIYETESYGSGKSVEFRSHLLKERLRTAFTGIGFAMSVVGIWGDGFNGFTSRS
ncbi:Autophagy-related protein 33 [Erysiphe necator]|nr:Autophagy-related protein 33 [Erysiphe necator]